MNGDCLNEMNNIDDQSIDFICTDLPFGTTQCRWDTKINLDRLWVHYKRIIKDNGAIALFAQTPFDKVLGVSNLEMLKYEIIWHKTKATGHLNAKKMPLKAHENILIFYKKLPTYNAQKTAGHKPTNTYTKYQSDGDCYGKTKVGISGGGNTDRYPLSVLNFSSDTQKISIHPTQKPVALLEWLIRTYTNEGDTVLDSCFGSGSCAEAALNCNRGFIGIEKDLTIFKSGKKRIEESQMQTRMFA